MQVPSNARTESARALLRAAFADELRARVPRIEERTDLEVVRRDVHTLASSAWVVDEPEIARIARTAEDDLTDENLDALLALLRVWLP